MTTRQHGPRYQQLPLCRDAQWLLVEIERAVRSFPRYHKYTLGSELRTQAKAVNRLVACAAQVQFGRADKPPGAAHPPAPSSESGDVIGAATIGWGATPRLSPADCTEEWWVADGHITVLISPTTVESRWWSVRWELDRGRVGSDHRDQGRSHD